MEDTSVAAILLLGAVLKQSLSILAATLCIYFGYRLFYLTEQKSGEFEASASWGKVRLSQAAPGVFFTLFGCIVLVVALVTFSSFESKAGSLVATAKPKAAVEASKSNSESNFSRTSIVARGASAAAPRTIDWDLCAKSAAYGRDLLRSDPGYADAASARGVFLRNREDGLERVTAYCVDQLLGNNSYARYVRVEAGGNGNENGEDEKIHEAVAAVLGE